MLPLDDRDGWISLDRGLVPWREAKLHVLSHGLHYGAPVEGERAYDGRIVALASMATGCGLLRPGRAGMRLDGEAARRAAQSVVTENGSPDPVGDGWSWRGSGVLAVGARQKASHNL